MAKATLPNNHPTYATDARFLIGNVEEFRKSIIDYLSQGSKNRLPKNFANLTTLLSEAQVIEAIQNSTSASFLSTVMGLIAEDTSVKKHLIKNRGKIEDDLEIIKQAMFAAAEEEVTTEEEEEETATKNKKFDMQELEDLYKSTFVQSKNIDDTMTQLEGEQVTSWAASLNALIKKHRTNWAGLMKLLAEDLRNSVRTNLGIELSELELNELIKPTRRRRELLKELEKAKLGKLQPKHPEKLDTFNLRVLWIIGAAHGRTMKTLDAKACNRVLKSLFKAEAKQKQGLVTKHQQDYNTLVGNLNGAKDVLRKSSGLTDENRQRLMLSMPGPMLEKLLTARPTIPAPRLTA